MVMSVAALLPTYAPFPFTMVRGENDRVWDEAGSFYWDFYGGHCVALTGHSHPAVVAALKEQASKLLFYSTAGKIDVRDRAAQALVEYAGPPCASVFFCNSGAEANENALKIATLLTGRSRFVSIAGGWHGRSTLALSVTDDPPIRAAYAPLLAPSQRLPLNDLNALREADFSEVAAVIVEPVQSMAGVLEARAEWARELRAKCREAGTLLIFDEIQTGFGRLGAPFGKDVLGVDPDLMTVAKGMASGVPMGGVLMSSSVAERLKPGDLGSTFGGGPLACAALLATLGIVRDGRLAEKASEAESRIRQVLEGTAVSAVRGRGLLLGLRCATEAKALKAHLFEKRILVGGSHDPSTLRLMPPLTVTDEAIEALGDAVRSLA